MLARRLPTVLPLMTFAEAIETTKIHSVAGLLTDKAGLIGTRLFRALHHTMSDAGLIGGGKAPRPGEVSLAHNGVLPLDELPEFQRHVLDVLWQPVEDGEHCNKQDKPQENKDLYPYCLVTSRDFRSFVLGRWLLQEITTALRFEKGRSSSRLLFRFHRSSASGAVSSPEAAHIILSH